MPCAQGWAVASAGHGNEHGSVSADTHAVDITNDLVLHTSKHVAVHMANDLVLHTFYIH
jgi:protein-tyrosine-phosphatase